MLSVYTVPFELTSPRFARAFAAGCGGVIKDYRDCPDGPWSGFGSPHNWDMMQSCIKAGFDFWMGDHAYFGRHKYYKVTRNAYQHSGIGEPDFDRLRLFFAEAARWKKGGNIILCPQSANHLERFGAPDWLEETKKELRKYTDRKIIVRYKQDRKPLGVDLQSAWAVVTHSSASAVHAIMHGVPAFCTAQCAASSMSLSDLAKIETPYYPDGRMEWAAVLAANQWTLEEIKRGDCWRAIGAEV